MANSLDSFLSPWGTSNAHSMSERIRQEEHDGIRGGSYFNSSGMKKSADEVSQIAHRELVPKLTAAGGLIRFVTIGFSHGRYGSFSAYESQDAASGAIRSRLSG